MRLILQWRMHPVQQQTHLQSSANLTFLITSQKKRSWTEALESTPTTAPGSIFCSIYQEKFVVTLSKQIKLGSCLSRDPKEDGSFLPAVDKETILHHCLEFRWDNLAKLCEDISLSHESVKTMSNACVFLLFWYCGYLHYYILH